METMGLTEAEARRLTKALTMIGVPRDKAHWVLAYVMTADIPEPAEETVKKEDPTKPDKH